YIAAGGILGQELDLAAEDAALGIHLLDRERSADLLVLAELGIGAGQRVVEADPDRLLAAHGDDEGARDLHHAGRRCRLEDRSAMDPTGHHFAHQSPPFAFSLTLKRV